MRQEGVEKTLRIVVTSGLVKRGRWGGGGQGGGGGGVGRSDGARQRAAASDKIGERLDAPGDLKEIARRERPPKAADVAQLGGKDGGCRSGSSR